MRNADEKTDFSTIGIIYGNGAQVRCSPSAFHLALCLLLLMLRDGLISMKERSVVGGGARRKERKRLPNPKSQDEDNGKLTLQDERL